MIRTAALLICIATPALAQAPDGLQKQYYDDGTLAGEITRSEGKLDGPWRSYYPSGQLREEAFYKAGRIDGVERKFHENGQLAAEVHWTDGERDGAFRDYDRDGNLTMQGTYDMGQPSGTREAFWPSGALRAVRHFDEGREVGLSRRWTRDGVLTRETEYTDAGVFVRERRWKEKTLISLREPVQIDGHGEGEKLTEYQGNFTETDIKAEGYRLTTRSLNGELIDRSEVIDGQMQGLYISTDPIQGDVTRVTYVDNQPHGLFTRTWKGRVLDRGMYDHGKRVGEWRREETTPFVELETYDAKGRLDGEQRTLGQDGKVRMRVTYAAGTLDGPYETFGSGGEILEVGQYDMGQKTGLWQEISGNLEDLHSGSYVEDKRDGRWTITGADGHPVEVIHYDMGEEDGLHYLFAPDGAVDEVQAWRDGVRDGYTTYYQDGRPVLRDLWQDGTLTRTDLPVVPE
ncbi:MORN repeat variant [Pseudooceanicola marinus]|uniref:MORN repeat variant n=1 Tax=Pseudooceanicola marinus TaxID=396013 RepID=A0A1X6ZD10_9RHOB|nr:toxin-antitoxin system YwqK family antitoxin [Pseudooceanicola marinus]PJE28325.1 hypothetical protein CVM50_15395 [Pseudooceanicola marinus]SLN47848.1 MORN repeat variant [Pseudooceanicola marinus]